MNSKDKEAINKVKRKVARIQKQILKTAHSKFEWNKQYIKFLEEKADYVRDAEILYKGIRQLFPTERIQFKPESDPECGGEFIAVTIYVKEPDGKDMQDIIEKRIKKSKQLHEVLISLKNIDTTLLFNVTIKWTYTKNYE